ncbi:MAG: pitrilysin family protein [Bacteroidota bacterium]|nr:pitrilysin family protein [Bacteroidota bacterium]
MELQTLELGNGIQVLHLEVENQIAHFGIFINTGSRDELDTENGMAHFIEHSIFKGTKKRKAYHVLSRLESVGGDLNAFTTKEFTCIYASFLRNYYERAFELISDISFNSVFPAKEIEKEKVVIIDEINSYLDTPFEYIFDEFEKQIFNGHPLSRNILGEPEVIKHFQRENILEFIRKNYRTQEMVICSVGKISLKKVTRLAEKYFNTTLPDGQRAARELFNGYQPSGKVLEKNSFQNHCMMGNKAYSRQDPKRIAFSLLNNILGGPGLNSRLNLMIREKYGFTYHIESTFQSYTDTGIWGIYLGTTNGTMNRTIKLVHNELKKLRDKKLGSLQLKGAKTQFVGQIAIHLEPNLNKMLAMGKSYLMDGKVDSMLTIQQKIEAISAEDILDVANEVFAPDQSSSLIYKSK